MNGFNFSFGVSNAARQRAEQAMIEAEDRMMDVDEFEEKDLGFHVSKEAQRTKILLTRLRQMTFRFEEKIDRNTTLTLIIGLVLIMKGVVTAQDLRNFFHWLGFI